MVVVFDEGKEDDVVGGTVGTEVENCCVNAEADLFLCGLLFKTN